MTQDSKTVFRAEFRDNRENNQWMVRSHVTKNGRTYVNWVSDHCTAEEANAMVLRLNAIAYLFDRSPDPFGDT